MNWLSRIVDITGGRRLSDGEDTMSGESEKPVNMSGDRKAGAPGRGGTPVKLGRADHRAGGSAAPALAQKPVLRQPGIELLARDLEQLGCISLVVAGRLQSALDELTLGLVESLGRESGGLARGGGLRLDARRVTRRPRRRVRLILAHGLRQILQTNPGIAAEGNRALDGVGEFAHVARPRISEQRGHRVLCDAG